MIGSGAWRELAGRGNWDREEQEKDLAINSLGMAFAYLSDALIDE